VTVHSLMAAELRMQLQSSEIYKTKLTQLSRRYVYSSVEKPLNVR